MALIVFLLGLLAWLCWRLYREPLQTGTVAKQSGLGQTGVLLEELRAFYQREGISAEGFACPMASSCMSAAVDFIPAREAFVGSEYEKGTLPRVLFVSLDPAKDLSGRNPANRTLTFMRQSEEGAKGCDPTRLPKGDHWYQTHLFAHDLLNEVSIQKGLGPIPFAQIHRHFAHTNSAKCKDAAQGTAQGRALLFRNCRRFIAPEVRTLKPEILVTQGSMARDAIKGQFPVIRSGRCSTNDNYYYSLVSMDDRLVLSLAMAHPKARGGLYQIEKREAYSWYLDVAHRFMLEGPAALGP